GEPRSGRVVRQVGDGQAVILAHGEVGRLELTARAAVGLLGCVEAGGAVLCVGDILLRVGEWGDVGGHAELQLGMKANLLGTEVEAVERALHSLGRRSVSGCLPDRVGSE